MSPLEGLRSRRELLAGATAGAALAAGCGSGSGGKSPGERDADLLNLALADEHTAVAAYRAGAPLLTGGALRAARRIAAQERAHARALTRAVRRLGGAPAAPRLPEEYARSFPRLRSAADVLRFARDLEERIVRVYMELLPQLSDPALRPMVGAIVASEAEHLAVIRARRGEPPAPDAFVTGKER